MKILNRYHGFRKSASFETDRYKSEVAVSASFDTHDIDFSVDIILWPEVFIGVKLGVVGGYVVGWWVAKKDDGDDD